MTMWTWRDFRLVTRHCSPPSHSLTLSTPHGAITATLTCFSEDTMEHGRWTEDTESGDAGRKGKRRLRVQNPKAKANRQPTRDRSRRKLAQATQRATGESGEGHGDNVCKRTGQIRDGTETQAAKRECQDAMLYNFPLAYHCPSPCWKQTKTHISLSLSRFLALWLASLICLLLSFFWLPFPSLSLLHLALFLVTYQPASCVSFSCLLCLQGRV